MILFCVSISQIYHQKSYTVLSLWLVSLLLIDNYKLRLIEDYSDLQIRTKDKVTITLSSNNLIIWSDAP